MAERKELKPGQKVMVICTKGRYGELFGEITFLKEFGKIYALDPNSGQSLFVNAWLTSPPLYISGFHVPASFNSHDLLPIDDPDIDAQLRQERHELNVPLVRKDVPNPFLI